jgi:preprotein translocase subunit YajC
LKTTQFFLAQAETPAPAPAESATTAAPGTPANKTPAPQAADTATWMVPLMIIMLVFYVLVFRSKRKQDRQRSNMLQQLKRGDRIQTIGGILGTVVEARETEVVVKVDESNNIKLRFNRSAIHRVIEEEKSEAK